MFGIVEAVFTTLLDVNEVNFVVCHGLGWFAKQSLDESVGSTQGRIKYLGSLDVERGSSIADLDVAVFLLIPGLFKMALLT